MQRLPAADLIIHAGDLSTLAVLEELRTFGTVVAVHGNVDDARIQEMLPAEAEVELPGDRRLNVVHDAGPRRGRLNRLRRRFPEASGVVFGHSHLPLQEASPDGFQIFNPGSPTERRRAPHHTMGWASVGEAGLEFRLIQLD